MQTERCTECEFHGDEWTDDDALEATALADKLAGLSPVEWAVEAVLDSQTVDTHWVARHIVHDATHHLLDVQRLRDTLAQAT